MDNLMSAPEDPVIVRVDSEKTISGYAAIKDIYGRPIIFAHISSPRTVYNSGKQTVFYFMAWITALAILSCAVILILFNKLLIAERERQEKEARRRMEQEALKAQKIESLGVLAGGKPTTSIISDRDSGNFLAKVNLDPGVTLFSGWWRRKRHRSGPGI
jgi:hypothetical protein